MITVTYESEILGAGEHWYGQDDEIANIPNRVARRMAELTVQDGLTRTAGMWTVKKMLLDKHGNRSIFDDVDE